MSETSSEIQVDHGTTSPTKPLVNDIKKELFDPRTISKKNDQEGRNRLAIELGKNRQVQNTLHEEMVATQAELDKRQSNLLVKLKTKLNIPDKKVQELEALKIEQAIKGENIPDTKKMVEAYYEKVAETPLTNQEKRDLLKPEVLSQLSTDEYIALWKRLNPYFLTHVTRQGFRDHNAMFYHSGGMREFHNGFLGVMQDEKMLRPPLALKLKNRDEVSVKMFLSEWVLQAENEEDAKTRFDNLLHWSLAKAPKYSADTAVHFAAQLAANDYYGGETRNEIMFVFPSDVLASQYNFTFNGWEKDFTHPQSETKWNDVFVWPNTLKDPGFTIDSGIVFLPENTQVDSNTGSRYASEVKNVEGKDVRVMVENADAIEKYNEWAQKLNKNTPLVVASIRARKQYDNREPDHVVHTTRVETEDICRKELVKLGFDDELIERSFLSDIVGDIGLWEGKVPFERFKENIDHASAKWKKAENTITAKEYWENFFADNPNLKPKHIVYYDGDPTTAIYRFEQQNEIGNADIAKVEEQLLGFDDHHITDVVNDPRSNQGHEELVLMGNKIIEEHYRNKI